MKTKHDRWIDAALIILDNPDMETSELAQLAHDKTGVPKELIEKELRWHECWTPGDMLNSKALDDYLDED